MNENEKVKLFLYEWGISARATFVCIGTYYIHDNRKKKKNYTIMVIHKM